MAYNKMDYKQTIEFLYDQLPVYQRDGAPAYKNNLNNTIELDNYFGNPHQNFKTIHIAGTNGKGSVSHMLASVLIQSGFNVGLYTSPHLKDFRERITINGQLISKDFVTSFVDQHKDIIEKIKPSFFELTVAMAFDYFNKQAVDIAVIETGMGGRLDSTNIIKPLVSIITNIGFDHVKFLGNTLKQIATEKAGIIKPDTPVIIGEHDPETAPVFKQIADQLYAPIIFADKRFFISNHNIDKNHQSFFAKNEQSGTTFEITLDLLGIYQKQNAITVLAALDFLTPKLKLNKKNIIEGLTQVVKNTGFKGRWQILNQQPLTICDTGHNAHGIKQVVQQLELYNYNNLHFVIGAVNDKDIDQILKLLPKNAIYYFTKASIPRALDQNILKQKAAVYNLTGNSYPTVEIAVNQAKKAATNNDLIFIGGSTFIVAEIPEL